MNYLQKYIFPKSSILDVWQGSEYAAVPAILKILL